MSQINRARTYDALSRWYGRLAEPSEGPLRRECLDRLCLQPGERVLDIGSGPGTDLIAVAARVGETGVVCGLDLARGMLRVCQAELSKGSRESPIRLVQGDGLRLPFRTGTFDAVVLSFTLELFEDIEIPQVLHEAGRVIQRRARIGVVSLSSRHPRALATRAYWRAHKAFPHIIDCRPIDAPGILSARGYEVVEEAERSMWGLRVAIVVARRAMWRSGS